MLSRHLTLAAFSVLAFSVAAASAFANEFVPLAPIPNLDTGANATLASYLESIFYFAITIGGVLAVLMIIWGGFMYMTSEAITQKGDARRHIQSAIMGLLLLLASVLILTLINPDLLKLDPFTRLQSAPATGQQPESAQRSILMPPGSIPSNYPGGRPAE